VGGGLSGDLSHKFPLPKNAKFIGVLSRFTSPLIPPSYAPNLRFPLDCQGRGDGGDKHHLLVVLSGPEPQRTVFEKKIIEQLASPPAPLLKERGVLIVQGITEKNERINLPAGQAGISDNVEMVSHLTSDELQKEIISSEIVVTRPGYSTVMDLAILGKKAIFVPTPGQTEQEYLAGYFSGKKIAYSVSQKKFDLNIALKESEKYSGFTEKYSGEEFKKAVDGLLSSLRA
jgi:hypothetical protein